MTVNTDEETRADESDERSASRLSALFNLCLAGLAAAAVVASIGTLVDELAHTESRSTAEMAARIAADSANILFLTLIMVLLVVRHEPVRKADGLGPRLAAVAGTFMIGPIIQLTDPRDEVGLVVLGLCLVASGFALATYTLAYLGRSFSVMAEARRLVRSGPYGIVRHPLYVTEQVAVLGVVVGRLSALGVVLLFVHIAVQARRALTEERVLAASFPEYEAYALETPRFVPRIDKLR